MLYFDTVRFCDIECLENTAQKISGENLEGRKFWNSRPMGNGYNFKIPKNVYFISKNLKTTRKR